MIRRCRGYCFFFFILSHFRVGHEESGSEDITARQLPGRHLHSTFSVLTASDADMKKACNTPLRNQAKKNMPAELKLIIQQQETNKMLEDFKQERNGPKARATRIRNGIVVQIISTVVEWLNLAGLGFFSRRCAHML